MWFKKSSVQLSAVLILALTTRNYMTAGIFFTLGVVERMEENEEEEIRKRIEHDYIINLYSKKGSYYR